MDGLQPFNYQSQGHQNRPVVAPLYSVHPTLRMPRSIYELEGQPLEPRQLPTAHAALVSVMQRVMQGVDDLQDLFSLALVNRASYTAFKVNELGLIKATLRRISPPAWELREVSEVRWDTKNLLGGQSLAASLYYRHYTRDVYYLMAIKFLLQDHCEPLLSDRMVTGLRDSYGSQAGEVDAAIWRVWKFCYLFGNQKDREQDVKGQERWLRGEKIGTLPVCQTTPDPTDLNTVLFTPPDGFAQGNAGGLSKRQLLDMVDIWIAMGGLLDFLRKETRRARENGIFNAADPPPKTPQEEVQVLSAWLDFILTLGPTVVVQLAPEGRDSDPDIAFTVAAANGWTRWTAPAPEAPRTKFLLGVVHNSLRRVSDDKSVKNMI